MRVAAGTSLVLDAVETLTVGPDVASAVLHTLSAGVGILLLIGLWTPVVGVLVALDAAWQAFSSPGDAAFFILVGILAAALALLGPGAWSIDARLFGWKRIAGGRPPL
jgi:putative oxidoreductase